MRWWLAALVMTCVGGCLGPDPIGDPEVHRTGTFTFTAAPTSLDAVDLQEFASGFSQPILLTHAGDGSGDLYVAQRGGTVWHIAVGQNATLWGDLRSHVRSSASEQGLLGLAFPPGWSAGEPVVVSYSDSSGDTAVAWMATAPTGGMTGAPDVFLSVDQPFSNHNGGHIVFGPDGYLYVGLGDGGSAGDPQGNGQNQATLLGSILRIKPTEDGYDVPSDNPFTDSATARDEIWHWGLRNPWRFSFDQETGELWIGDVGQNTWEEIDHAPAGAGGLNFGWNAFEGNHQFPTGAPASSAPGMTFPVAEYRNGGGACSVTGGFVYRGEALPALQGHYVWGDYCSGEIWVMQGPDGAAASLLETDLRISSFGEDEAGELYVVDYQGKILRFAATGG